MSSEPIRDDAFIQKEFLLDFKNNFRKKQLTYVVARKYVASSLLSLTRNSFKETGASQ